MELLALAMEVVGESLGISEFHGILLLIWQKLQTGHVVPATSLKPHPERMPGEWNEAPGTHARLVE